MCDLIYGEADKGLSETQLRKVRNYREYSYWYAVGRRDERSKHVQDSDFIREWDFSRYAVDIARAFERGETSYLPSIPEAFKEFSARNLK